MLMYKASTDTQLRVGEVQFALLSPEEIERMSTVEVKDTTIYYRGLPNPNGINDHRMGTVDRRLLCGSCCRDVKFCQGHVGHIQLSFPVYHVGFFDMTFKTLRSVCFACSRLCVSNEELLGVSQDMSPKARFAMVSSIARTKKRCCHCGMLRPTYVRNALSIRIEWPADMEWQSEEEMAYCTELFTARSALSILTHMTETDIRALGIDPVHSHPKHTIITTLLVPPPVARPAIMASEGSRSRGQDDLTHKLQDINKRSQEVVAHINKQDWRHVPINAELFEKIQKLQFEVFTYMNNNIRGQKQSTQRSGAPTKSIIDRLKGKDGRIRGNLMGKRVDFSARSVITPDAVMDVDEVGIPYKIAMALTIPEVVTSQNIAELTKRAMNGPFELFGAETIITNNGINIQLAHCEDRNRIRLQYGWVVERFLKTGDVVIFNRQPSLHKMGMMGHRVRLMPGLTFRLNLCCANPYNADFDGDEMNLHVPQSLAASADIATLMMVSRQIISPQANRPVMGIVQDSLLGAFLFSANDIYLEREDVCDLLARLRYRTKEGLPTPAVIAPKELWTGKQLLGELLPVCMNYNSVRITDDTKTCEVDSVLVRGGRIVSGQLKKKHLGTAAGGFIDVLFRDYGSVVTVRWMSDLQRLVNAWLCMRGFSVGIHDCLLTDEGEMRVKDRVSVALSQAEDLLRMPVDEASDEKDVMESTIVRILSKTLMQAGSIVEDSLRKDNAIRCMVNAGSKGNPINLSQICGCVGQQSVEGHRIFAEKGERTLPCFHMIDKSLTGQGFVTNSYALGLHPHEYFFHAMGGREGLVDTAVKTATTGYIQRRQMKSMEDHRVCEDRTVRNAEECIVDFVYGGDDMEASHLERIKLPLLLEDDASILKRMTACDAKNAILCRDLLIRCKLSPFVTEIDERILVPFNPTRLRLRFLMHHDKEPASMDTASRMLTEALAQYSCTSTRAVILNDFHAKELIYRGASVDRIAGLFRCIRKKHNAARVQAGEMVGSIAAQSIGEPATQMSLCSKSVVLVKRDGELCCVQIGKLVDGYLPPVVSDDQHNVTTVRQLECIGVSSHGKAMWTNVTHVSRHPANGEMITVRTRSGRVVRATASHSFLVRSGNRVVPTPGANLTVGDRVPIVQNFPDTKTTNTNGRFLLSRTLGRLVGVILSAGVFLDRQRIDFCSVDDKEWLVHLISDAHSLCGDAVFSPEIWTRGERNERKDCVWTCNHTFGEWFDDHFVVEGTCQKRLPTWVIDAPEEFVAGLLQSYFDDQGEVCDDPAGMRCRKLVPIEFTLVLHLCLARFGITGNVERTCIQNRDEYVSVQDGGKERDIWNLQNAEFERVPMATSARVLILAVHVEKFEEHIGFGKVSFACEARKLYADVMRKDETDSDMYVQGMRDVLADISEYMAADTEKGAEHHSCVDGEVRRSFANNSDARKEGPRCSKENEAFDAFCSELLRTMDTSRDISVEFLVTCREHVLQRGAPKKLIDELNIAIDADVWWDTIVSIHSEENSSEMVYDFTVEDTLQSFMLLNGVFVHNTLNTFHYAGVISKNVTLGIPRLKELLDQSRNIRTPCNTIRFLPPYNKNVKFATYFANTISLTRLEDIVTRCEVVFDEDPDNTVVQSDKVIVQIESVLRGEPILHACRYVARLILNKPAMKCRCLTPPMVKRLLKRRLNGRAHIVASETNALEWIVRIRFLDVRLMLEYLDAAWGQREALLCHRAITALLDTVAICGHPKITGAQLREINTPLGLEYVVDTQGCSLLDLSAANVIDWNMSTTNDIQEVISLFGIEAAATTLYHELTTTLSFDGTYVDPRHIVMIVNTMTFRGYIMPLSRHGINRMDTGPLLRCSFEETPDILCDAACFGEKDNGKGVSQNIMTGKLAPIGSGSMLIRMPMHCMPPRVQQEKRIGQRVLKSSVRVAKTQHPETTSSVLVDPPYIEDTSERLCAPSRKASSIFSNGCGIFSKPYEEDVGQNVCTEKYSSTRKRKYVPSSPDKTHVDRSN